MMYNRSINGGKVSPIIFIKIFAIMQKIEGDWANVLVDENLQSKILDLIERNRRLLLQINQNPNLMDIEKTYA